MRKIPTLFNREYENHKIVNILPEVTEGMEWVLEGEGETTVKYDGSCCAIINGELYKRYDARKGKKPPKGAIPCCEADPITGHHPHWVKCDKGNPADKWFLEATKVVLSDGIRIRDDRFFPHYSLEDGTYEAVGKHFNGNPYQLEIDVLVPHGKDVVKVERSFEGIRKYLRDNYIEGLVFWKDGEPQCKIKRTDFGFYWNKR